MNEIYACAPIECVALGWGSGIPISCLHTLKEILSVSIGVGPMSSLGDVKQLALYLITYLGGV